MAEEGREKFLKDLNAQIKNNKVVPIISGSLWYERLFPFEPETGCDNIGMRWMVNNYIASRWAENIQYRLPDGYNMAKVGELYIARRAAAGPVKTEFVDFLKELFLDACRCQGIKEEEVEMIRSQRGQSDFAKLVYALKNSSSQRQSFQTLDILAALPFRYYLTTCCHTFLEDALIRNGKTPKTDVYCWKEADLASINDEHLVDEHFKPTENSPLVVHLFGHEKYPDTLVLTEDDHLRFFLSFTKALDLARDELVIHPKVNSVISTSSVLFLGFRLEDWDFKVLFHALYTKPRPVDTPNFIIHLDPNRQYRWTQDDIDLAKKYLEEYLARSMFRVDWGDTLSFLEALDRSRQIV